MTLKPEWIAKTTFDVVPPRGRKAFALAVRIGCPVSLPVEGRLSGYSRCPVSLTPVLPVRWIAGENQFQALCLALEFIRLVLKAYVVEGGRIYYPNSDNPIDVDSPSFVPLASLRELTKRPPRARKRMARK